MNGAKISLPLPKDTRRRHLVTQGDLTATSGVFFQEVKLPEMIAAAEEMSAYTDKRQNYALNRGQRPKGIGMSLFFHGCGFTGNGERDYIKAEVRLVKDRQGNVKILAANVDMGQGVKTTLKKIVAGILEIPLDNIIYENPDTDRVPDSGPTVASRSIMIVGRLLEQAAMELKERWAEPGSVTVVKKYVHPPRMQWDDRNFCGDAYPAYSWGVNVVEVEIDPLTWEVDVIGVWTVFDVGRPIDARIVQGQIEGGVLQPLLWLWEFMRCGKRMSGEHFLSASVCC